jgi:hypothetical protein
MLPVIIYIIDDDMQNLQFVAEIFQQLDQGLMWLVV